MLIKARQWINETFDQKSKPTQAKVRSWVESGALEGQIIGDEVFVSDTFATQAANEVQPVRPDEPPVPHVNLL